DDNGGIAWNEFSDYALTSYAFHGEDASGNWELFLIASNPDVQIEVGDVVDGTLIRRPSVPCTAKNPDGSEKDYAFAVEARIVAQEARALKRFRIFDMNTRIRAGLAMLVLVFSLSASAGGGLAIGQKLSKSEIAELGGMPE